MNKATHLTFIILLSCDNANIPTSPKQQDLADIKKSYSVVNGDISSHQNVAALLHIHHEDGLDMYRDPNINLGANNPCSSVIIGEGCGITNAHCVEGGGFNYLSNAPFANMENFFEWYSSRDDKVIGDYERSLLKKAVYPPALQRKYHPKVYTEGAFSNDLAVFYFPPSWGFEYIEGKGLNRSKAGVKSFEYKKANISFEKMREGTHTKLVGYGLRNSGKYHSSIIDNLKDQRVGIERSGELKFLADVDILSRTAPIKNLHLGDFILSYAMRGTGLKVSRSLASSWQGSNAGDSGGAHFYKDNLVSINVGTVSGYEYIGDDPLNDGRILPTLSVNLADPENRKFLEDASYFREFGANLKLTCRAKPFFYFGPGSFIGAGLEGESDVGPNHTLGTVIGTVKDPLGEYQEKTKRCGLKPNGDKSSPSMACEFAGYDQHTFLGPPIIEAEFEAIPPSDSATHIWSFDKWMSPKGRDCICELIKAGAKCIVTNELILEKLPHTLFPGMANVCYALFKNRAKEHDGSCSSSGVMSPGCSN